MKTHILINLGGGSAGDRSKIEQALSSADVAAELQWLDGREIGGAAKAAVAAGAGIVVAGGGDGTVSAVAQALIGTSTKLGVLPLGTLNHFARDLGIPLGIDDALQVIATGRDRRVDIAEVNGRTFVNNSVIGLYPLMVLDREAQRQHFGRSKRWAMAVAAARTVFRFSSQRLTLAVNDREARVDTPLLFVGNNAYRLEMPGAGRREALDRGELFVLVLRRKSRLGFCLASLRALIGLSRPDDVARIEDVRNLRVWSAHGWITISLDGETVRLKSPLDYAIRPKAIAVLVP